MKQVARIELDDSTTEQVEQPRASAYSVPFGLPAADVDADGDVDINDTDQIRWDMWVRRR